jgi:peptide/nickel transport system substrate-binding protein
MRKYTTTGIVLVLTLLVAACGGGSGRSGTAASNSGTGSSKKYAELRWGELAFPGRLNYYDNIQPPSDLTPQSLVTLTLVEFAPSGIIKKSGYLATNEQVNPTTYVYHLKPRKFSDGTPLTSADVVFSMRQHLYGKESPWGIFWKDMASATAQGKSTVVVKLKRPEAVWQDVLAFNSQIIEKAQAERVGEKTLGTPGHLLIGAGPWKFDSYIPNTSITLSPNPYWTGPSQPAQKITFTLFKEESAEALALRSGAIDGASNYVTPKVFLNIPGTKQLATPGTGETYIAMNTTQAPFNDVHVRRAIAYAVNVKGIIKALFPEGQAVETTSVVPRSLFGDLGSEQQQNEIVDSLPKYGLNLSAARKELQKSAYPHGFSTTIEVNQTIYDQTLIAQIAASDLAKVGIHVKIDDFPPSEEADIFGKRITLLVTEVIPGYLDPEGTMQFLLLPDPSPEIPINASYYSNATVLRLMKETSESGSVTTRRRLIGEILRTVGSEEPDLPIYSRTTLATLSDKYVYPSFSYWTSILTPWALSVKLAE